MIIVRDSLFRVWWSWWASSYDHNHLYSTAHPPDKKQIVLSSHSVYLRNIYKNVKRGDSNYSYDRDVVSDDDGDVVSDDDRDVVSDDDRDVVSDGDRDVVSDDDKDVVSDYSYDHNLSWSLYINNHSQSSSSLSSS